MFLIHAKSHKYRNFKIRPRYFKRNPFTTEYTEDTEKNTERYVGANTQRAVIFLCVLCEIYFVTLVVKWISTGIYDFIFLLKISAAAMLVFLWPGPAPDL